MRVPALVLFGSLLTSSLSAQQPPDSASPAAHAGLTVAPKWGQSKEVQRQYEEECYGRARAQTGADPAAIAAAADSTAATQPESAGGGATTGIIGGRRMARSARLQAAALEDFRKVMSACLEAGGYTVQ